MVRASNCQCQSRNSPGFKPAASSDTVESGGGRCSNVENSTETNKNPQKNPFLIIYTIHSNFIYTGKYEFAHTAFAESKDMPLLGNKLFCFADCLKGLGTMGRN